MLPSSWAGPSCHSTWRLPSLRSPYASNDTTSCWPDALWRPGVDVGMAIAVYGVVVSLGSFDTATREYGWSPDEVESWWNATLVDLLFA